MTCLIPFLLVLLTSVPHPMGKPHRPMPNPPAPTTQVNADQGNKKARADETARMVKRLEQLARDNNWEINPYANTRRANAWQARLAGELPLNERITLQARVAVELLNDGQTKEAMAAFKTLQKLHTDNGLKINPSLLNHYLAICWLRLGEQQNCIDGHTTESCLFPIRGGGVHRRQEGSRGAVAVLKETLKAEPGNLTARWLLNIAYMTLGEYPDKVPPAWLIDPKRFEAEHEMQPFHDVAEAAGVAINGLAGGSITDDFDNDGYLDLFISSWGFEDQVRFMKNMGTGRFEDHTEQAGLTGITGGLNMIHADYNNDGFLDVLVLRGGWFGSVGHLPNSLLHNNGDGTFSDVTESAGLLASAFPTQTAVWFDHDNDGWLDLFIGNESDNREINVCELYRNNGDGTFSEIGKRAGADKFGFVKGVAAADYDNDGDTDLFLSRMGQSNILLRNMGPALKYAFENVAITAGVFEPKNSFPTWFWDYDNDGLTDLFVADYGVRDVGDVAADYLGREHPGERMRLFRNKGNGRFENVTRQTGLYRVTVAMGANYGDLDNDGYLDFYLGTGRPDLEMLVPNRMFRNDGGNRFQAVTSSGRFGHLQKGHGVSFADLDNDGDQDIHTVIGGAYSGDQYRNALFENPGQDNEWITLTLRGTRTNRAAIGARIELNLIDSDGGQRKVFRTVDSGGSFGGSPLRQEIGLGKAGKVERIIVTWPVSGEKQVFENVSMRAFYLLTEGKKTLERQQPGTFRFSGETTGHHHH